MESDNLVAGGYIIFNQGLNAVVTAEENGKGGSCNTESNVRYNSQPLPPSVEGHPYTMSSSQTVRLPHASQLQD
jgi:hypothetical protein